MSHNTVEGLSHVLDGPQAAPKATESVGLTVSAKRKNDDGASDSRTGQFIF